MKSFTARLAALRQGHRVGLARIVALALINGLGIAYFGQLLGVALSQPQDWTVIALGAGGMLLAAFAPVPIPGGGVFVPIFWPLLMLGMLSSPAITALVASIFSVEPRELSGRVPWYGFIYNRVVVLCTASIAIFVFDLIAGVDPTPGPLTLIAAGGAGLAFVVVNAPFVALAYFIRGLTAAHVFTRELVTASVFTLALAPLSWIGAQLYHDVGAYGPILLLPAVYLAWRGWRQLMSAADVQSLLAESERVLRAVAASAPQLFASRAIPAYTALLEAALPSHASAARLYRVSHQRLEPVGQVGVRRLSAEIEQWLRGADTLQLLAERGPLDFHGYRTRTNEGRLEAADQMGSCLLLPVRVSDELWGALLIISREVGHDFTSVERQTLLAVANVVSSAVVLERSRRRERKAADRVRERERRHRRVVETLAEGVVVVDADGRFISHNSAARSMLEPIVGDLDHASAKAVCERARTEDGRPYAPGTCPIDYALDARRPVSAVINLDVAGRTMTWLINARPIEDAAGREIVMSLADLTERRRMEAALLQAQRIESLGRLAGSVAHDANNVLGAVVGYAHLALDEIGDGPGREEIEQLMEAADRGRALTQQLLAFSRGQGLVLRTVDLNEVVEGMRPLLDGMSHAFGRGYEIEIELADRPLITEADVHRLEQVISNLVTNALEAMPTGGTVSLSTGRRRIDDASLTRPGRYVCLTVADTGIGIPEEARIELFTPFYTTKAEGTGLGLATVHGIVSQLGGAIEVNSDPGVGSRFVVLLPEGVGAAIETTEAASPTLQPTVSTSSAVVLVVDDEDDVREVSRRMLERSGYRVVTAANAVEAIEITERTRLQPDLLLTDIIMPGLDGRQLANHLRRTLPGLRVLFMSGWSDTAESADGDRRLDKPFSRAELIGAVEEALAAPLLA